MKFDSGENALRWLYETRIILRLAVSLKLTQQRVYFGGQGKHRLPNLKKIEIASTIMLLMARQSEAWFFIVESFFLINPSQSPEKIATELNKLHNTRRYNGRVVLDIYHKGMKRFEGNLFEGV